MFVLSAIIAQKIHCIWSGSYSVTYVLDAQKDHLIGIVGNEHLQRNNEK